MDRRKLIRQMMIASQASDDAVALAALRRASRMLDDARLTWQQILAHADLPVSPVPLQHKDECIGLFLALDGLPLDGGAQYFVGKFTDYFNRFGRLTKRQMEVLREMRQRALDYHPLLETEA